MTGNPLPDMTVPTRRLLSPRSGAVLTRGAGS
jgi:hypothetical protein